MMMFVNGSGRINAPQSKLENHHWRKEMLTPEQILAQLNYLRKDYEEDDNEDNLPFQALHHAFLFISYNMDAFKKYVAEAQKKESR